MNELPCREVDEALAAYASDGLEPGEHAAAASHLAECRNHDAELAALRQTFAGLASAAAPVEPPPSLRASLLEAFDREAGGAQRQPEPPPAATASPRTRLAPAAWLGYALAAALLVLAIGLGAWGASRGDGGEDELVFAVTTTEAGQLHVTYLPAHRLGFIEVDVPPLEEGLTYQAWRIDGDGNAASLGVLPSNAGSFALQDDLEGATAVALSVEPAGGSVSPTSNPILVTALN